MEKYVAADLQRRAIVAIDLGAESCRVSLLQFINGSPTFRVVHRCANAPIETDIGLVWDFDTIFANVLEGLRRCADLAPEGIASIGVDGWAVDYVRLDNNGDAIGKPFCYRDERTVASRVNLQTRISPERLYELTGAQDLRINTLYQLYADNLNKVTPEFPWVTLPEYLMYLLGGQRVCEFTNATHTQMVSVQRRDWCPEVFEAAGHRLAVAPPIVRPGTDIGQLSGPISELPAFQNTRIIAPACHDTASAIAGIPAIGDDWAFISSGTWSLVGATMSHSYVGEEARRENFTNQGGVDGTIYLLKNVNGMWMLRQCLDQWKLEGMEWQLPELIDACEELQIPSNLLDVDDPALMLPGDIPARINAQLQAHGHPSLPKGSLHAPLYASLIFHSLAARYAQVLNRLMTITGKQFKRLFIVGGGSRNVYLNRLVEKETGLEVIPASAESSTIGNFSIQLAALEQSSKATGVPLKLVAHWAVVLNNLPAAG